MSDFLQILSKTKKFGNRKKHIKTVDAPSDTSIKGIQKILAEQGGDGESKKTERKGN